MKHLIFSLLLILGLGFSSYAQASGVDSKPAVQAEDDGMIHLPVPHSVIFDEIEGTSPNAVGTVSSEKTAQEKGDRKPGAAHSPSASFPSPVRDTN